MVFLTSPLRLISAFSSHVYERSACWFCAADCFAAATYSWRSWASAGRPVTRATAMAASAHPITARFTSAFLTREGRDRKAKSRDTGAPIRGM